MDWFLFAIYLSACFGAGTTGAIFPPGPWYARLAKPSWTPPDWLFPVAWTSLYILMALAATRVSGVEGSEYALALWALQIAFNGLWTPVFFGLRRLKGGFAVVTMLWLAVAGCLAALWQVDRIAGLMFVPYLAWVTVAAALNLAVWRMNPAEPSQAVNA